MKYYAHLDTRDNSISKSQCQCLSDFVENIEITKDVYNDFDRYIYEEGQIVINKDYEKKLQQQANEKRKSEILSELELLDKKRIRAICEPSLKDVQDGNTWLEYYNSEIQKLRTEYASLN